MKRFLSEIYPRSSVNEQTVLQLVVVEEVDARKWEMQAIAPDLFDIYLLYHFTLLSTHLFSKSGKMDGEKRIVGNDSQRRP